MANTIKEKLTAALNEKGAARAAAPAADKSPKAPKAPAAEGARPGRAPRFSAIRINPEGGVSRVGEKSDRGLVLSLIRAAGDKGITVTELDEKFHAARAAAPGEDVKPTRGFVGKLLEKQHVIVVS